MNDELIDGEQLKCCFHCGKCTSGCEVNRIDPSFQPHRLLHLIGMGALDELINGDAIWKCTTCFTCSERCPQRIAVTDIFWSLRALAFRSCPTSGLLSAQKSALFKTGRLYPATVLDHKKREKAGLPALSENATLVSRIFDAAKADR